MSQKSRLIPISYYNPRQEVCLSAYADTIAYEQTSGEAILRAIRFGGYPEMVRALSDAVYAGCSLDAELDSKTLRLNCIPKQYARQFSHDGIYAEATILSLDDETHTAQDAPDELVNDQQKADIPPRKCILFCPLGDRQALFEALDRKTAVPLIPEFQDYVLSELQRRGELKPLRVLSIRERLEAWLPQT